MHICTYVQNYIKSCICMDICANMHPHYMCKCKFAIRSHRFSDGRTVPILQKHSDLICRRTATDLSSGTKWLPIS